MNNKINNEHFLKASNASCLGSSQGQSQELHKININKNNRGRGFLSSLVVL